MNDEQDCQLLYRLLLCLLPDVFFHPIWINFLKTGKAFSPELIQNLQNAATQLQAKGDLIGACQFQIICALLQDHLGDYRAALDSIERAWVLAENQNLSQLRGWVAWGAGAVCVHQGSYKRAAQYLKHLQISLDNDEEWVLANFIWLLRRTLLKQVGTNVIDNADDAASVNISPEEPLVLQTVFDWLINWQDISLNIEAICQKTAGYKLPDGHTAPESSLPFWSMERWRSFLRQMRRVINGQLQLKWVEKQNSASVMALARPKRHNYLQTPAPLPTLPIPSKPIASLNNHLNHVSATNRGSTSPFLTIYCLGTFRVYRDEIPLESWPGNKAKSIFKYLLFHRETPVNRDVLIDIFWGERVDIKAARKNLYQVIYTLRRALQSATKDFSYILFNDSCYYLNPELSTWIDSDVFLSHYWAGRQLEDEGHQVEAIAYYEAADSLYQGEFLAEDRYQDWPIIQRERLKGAHLDILERLGRYYFEQNQLLTCIVCCQKILAEDNCREDAHRRLMRCYLLQKQSYLALRQYHVCVEILKQELDVPPMPATTKLYKRIQQDRVHFSGSQKMNK